MARRSRAARPAARAAGAQGAGNETRTGGSALPGSAISTPTPLSSTLVLSPPVGGSPGPSPAQGLAPIAGLVWPFLASLRRALWGTVHTPASVNASSREPASFLLRWEPQAGPRRDAWDSLPFPAAGLGALGRLRAAAAASKLFARGRGGGGSGLLALSVDLGARGGAVPHLLPLNDDDDVANALQMWRLSSGIPGVMEIAVREEGGAAGAGGHRPATTLRNAVPGLHADAWAGVLNSLASSRCVVGGGLVLDSLTVYMVAGTALPP